MRSGAYYVDGYLASDYNAHLPATTWTFVRKYVAMRYDAGMPVMPEGHGLITWFKVALNLREGTAHGLPQPNWRRGAPLRSPERSPGRLGCPRGASEPALTCPRHDATRAFIQE